LAGGNRAVLSIRIPTCIVAWSVFPIGPLASWSAAQEITPAAAASPDIASKVALTPSPFAQFWKCGDGVGDADRMGRGDVYGERILAGSAQKTAQRQAAVEPAVVAARAMTGVCKR